MQVPVPEGRIFNIMRFSTHDGPGIRTTVFLKGCPLSCWWCHNPENWGHVPAVVYITERCAGCGACVAACPHQALSLTRDGVQADPERCRGCGACVRVCPAEARESTGRQIGLDELMLTVERDTPFYDQSEGGVTFSGGEPLAQPDFLFAALERCGRSGIHRAVDTSGYAAADVILRAARAADLFLYDLKVMDPETHRRCTGVDNAGILRNLEILSGAGAEIAIRIPLIPGVNDDCAQHRGRGGVPGRVAAAPPGRPAAVPRHRPGQVRAARPAPRRAGRRPRPRPSAWRPSDPNCHATASLPT